MKVDWEDVKNKTGCGSKWTTRKENEIFRGSREIRKYLRAWKEL
jgi:hypothetical protein